MYFSRKTKQGEDPMHCRGIVLWFNEKKKIGFIAHQNGEDLYFHAGDICSDEEHEITAGKAVVFDVVCDEPSPRAANVVLLGA